MIYKAASDSSQEPDETDCSIENIYKTLRRIHSQN